MRVEQEPRSAIRRPLPDLDEEREVDFGRLARTILRRWWLVALAVAAGALAGYLLSLGGGEVYQARATVYLGQTLSPAGSTPVQSPAANPALVSQIIRSESVVEEVARRVGVPPGQLRRGISSKAVTGAATRRDTPNLLAEVSVRGPWRAETAQAANLLAAAVVERVSPYVEVKIDTLEEQLAGQDRELAQVDRRLTALEASVRNAAGASSVERLQLLTLVGFAEQRRGQLLEERTQTRQLLSLAQNVERSRVLTTAAAVKVPARSPRSSIVVAALIGLLVGSALALLWEPAAARLRAQTA